MESATHSTAAVLTVLFALGLLGCAITIPVCAIRFLAILFERGEQPEITGYRMVPVYANTESAATSQPETTKPSPPRQSKKSEVRSQK